MNKYNSFTDLKNKLQVGDVLEIVYASDKYEKSHPSLNVKRKITKKQTNAIQLEGGSWLGLGSTGEKASNFTFTDKGFIFEDEYTTLEYHVHN